MQITFNKNQLLNPMLSLLGLTDTKTTMPILSNFYIEKSGDKTKIIANDMEIQGTVVIDELLSEDFKLTIPAKKITDILKSVAKDEVTIDISDSKCTVKSGKSKFSLQTLPPEHYPLLISKEEVQGAFTITQNNLKSILADVIYAMGVNDTRVFLNAALFQIKDGKLIVVATDAHRLSLNSIQINDALDSEVIVPRKTIIELHKTLSNTDGIVNIQIFNSQIVFDFGNKQILSKVIAAKYPDYNRVIPLTNDKVAKVNREMLLKTIQRVAVIGLDKLKTIKVRLGNNLINVTAINEAKEESNDVVECEFNHDDDYEFSFNISYLLDVLSNSSAKNLKFNMFDTQRSILITDDDKPDLRIVIMPLRV